MATQVIVAACLALAAPHGEVAWAFHGDILVVAPLSGPKRWVRLVGVGVPASADPKMPAPFRGRPDPDALERWLKGRFVALFEEPLLPRSPTRQESASRC